MEQVRGDRKTPTTTYWSFAKEKEAGLWSRRIPCLPRIYPLLGFPWIDVDGDPAQIAAHLRIKAVAI
jgi:hypothetical protein